MTLFDFSLFDYRINIEHQYQINARSISREQQLRMRNENVKLWGSSTVPWCGCANNHSFTAENYNPY